MTGIALGFVLIAALLLWFIIGSKGHWGSKAAMILLSLYFCLSVGFSVSEFMGWPTRNNLPEKFFVHWLVVDEPDSKTGDEGNIYIWLKKNPDVDNEHDSWEDYLLSFYDGDSQPRAYRMPYTRDLHEQAQEAIGMIRQGKGVGGTREGLEGEGEGEGEGTAKSKGAGGSNTGNQNGTDGGSLTRNGGVMFHELPPTKLPDKD
jgi:hypothetical protein